MKKKTIDKIPLRVLYLEDSPHVVEILRELLIDEGYDLSMDCTEEKKEFASLLHSRTYDVILSDFNLPEFDAFEALRLAIDICPEVPFICVSGSIGEETAIELIKQGAVDYILKDRMVRLPSAIKRALDEVKEKNARRRAEATLRESEERFRSLYENTTVGLYRTTPDGKILLANPTLVKMLGYSTFEELASRNLEQEGFEPTYDRKQFTEQIELNGEVKGLESVWIRQDGSILYIRESARAIRDPNGKTLYYDGRLEDITERKRMEGALAESEKKLKILFEILPVGVSVLDAERKIVYSNPALERILDVSSEGLFRGNYKSRTYLRSDGTLMPAEEFASVRAIKEQRAVHNVETGVVKEDGKVVWTNVSAVPLGFPDWNVLIVTSDITEHKRLEAARDQERILLRTIIDNLPNSIFVKDKEYRKIVVNPEHARRVTAHLGPTNPFSGEDLLGKTDFEVYPRELAEGFLVKDRRVIEGGQSMLDQDLLNIDASGQVHWELMSKIPLRNRNGEIIGLVGISNDITERKLAESQREAALLASKQAEEALRESESKYRNLIEQSWDALFVIDRTGNILLANEQACQLLGYTKEELLQLNIADTYLVEERAIAAQRIAAVKRGGILRYERSIVHKDGTPFPVEVAVGMLSNGLIQGTIRNITERKRAEEELRKSHEELRMLANHLQNIREEERNRLAREFHDQLGQSMTAMKMDLSLLLRTISDEKQEVQRKLIAEELQSMQKLVDETSQLVWAIITELRPQMLDDLGLVATFEWEAQQFESRTGISCEFKSSAGDIQMDSKKSIALFRIYQEALTNVAHHAKATVVKSVLRRDNEVLVLEIKDVGCGITLNEQLRSNSFGLIGMRERALALGGLFEINGIAGEGTTIMVRLPL